MPIINTHQNIAAFLDMLAYSEGTATHPLTKNRGYDVIVTGLDGKPEIFTDYTDHPFAHGRPAKVFNRRGEKSRHQGVTSSFISTGRIIRNNSHCLISARCRRTNLRFS